MAGKKKTYVLYHTMPDGTRSRVGTFRSSKKTIQEISAELKRQMPNLVLSECQIAPRNRYMEFAPMQCGLNPRRRRKHRNPKPPLGSGARFAALTRKLASRRGKSAVRDPRALAAWIGRRKYGKAKFQKLAAMGKWRHRAAGMARRKAANPPMNYITLALLGLGGYILYKKFRNS